MRSRSATVTADLDDDDAATIVLGWKSTGVYAPLNDGLFRRRGRGGRKSGSVYGDGDAMAKRGEEQDEDRDSPERHSTEVTEDGGGALGEERMRRSGIGHR